MLVGGGDPVVADACFGAVVAAGGSTAALSLALAAGAVAVVLGGRRRRSGAVVLARSSVFGAGAVVASPSVGVVVSGLLVVGRVVGGLFAWLVAVVLGL